MNMSSPITNSTLGRLFVTSILLSVLVLALPFAAQAAPLKTKKTVNNSCIQTAVETRETAIIASVVKNNTAMVKALTDRKTALNTAWGMSTGSTTRGAAIKKARSDWKADRKAANTALKTERLAAWSAFKKTAKDTCKVAVPKEDSLEKDSADSVAL